MKKFLIGQLARYGDCLYATTVARQIKKDYPDSHITWAVGSRYKSVVENNPFVDKIWEIEVLDNDYYSKGLKGLEKQAVKKKEAGEFDELFFTQVPDSNWLRFDGTIRSSVLKGYNRPITVPVDPVIRLTDEEVFRVNQFATKHNLIAFRHVILFECNPGSKQSFITPEYALEIASNINTLHKDTCFIMSSEVVLPTTDERIISAASLSFKENAELTKYCTLLIGCSSGLTWLATSDWAKKINMLQLLDSDFSLFAGIKYDHKKWNLPTDHIIEMTKKEKPNVQHCINIILENGFDKAKHQYDEELRPSYFVFGEVFEKQLLRKKYIFSLPGFIIQFYKSNRHLSFFKLCSIAFGLAAKALLSKKRR